uniref:demethoxyubiquinone hydroxylase family protein n=1 Tax=Orrella sp. TaxID=1921583 RepID=UPI00404725FB
MDRLSVNQLAVPEAQASIVLSKHLERELRSDHAGETGAVSIYEGIVAVSKWRNNLELVRFAQEHGKTEAELVAIYAQRRVQARLWLEAIFSDGALDPFITRFVGAAWLPADEALGLQDQLALVAPNIATARTESVLIETRSLLAQASGGLVVIAVICLAASLLVLASVVAASRTRQIYEATVMHALGARHALLVRVLIWEYVLIMLVTAAFAVLFGSALATLLLQWRLDISAAGLYWTGFVTAFGVSGVCLGLGARYLLGQMRLNPAMLLRTG